MPFCKFLKIYLFVSTAKISSRKLSMNPLNRKLLHNLFYRLKINWKSNKCIENFLAKMLRNFFYVPILNTFPLNFTQKNGKGEMDSHSSLVQPSFWVYWDVRRTQLKGSTKDFGFFWGPMWTPRFCGKKHNRTRMKRKFSNFHGKTSIS